MLIKPVLMKKICFAVSLLVCFMYDASAQDDSLKIINTNTSKVYSIDLSSVNEFFDDDLPADTVPETDSLAGTKSVDYPAAAGIVPSADTARGYVVKKVYTIVIDSVYRMVTDSVLVASLDSIYYGIDTLNYLNIDSMKKNGAIFKIEPERPVIVFSREQALSYLDNKIDTSLWKDRNDPFRMAIDRLVYEASRQPYDSSRYYLENYSYNKITVPWENFFVWDTLKYKVKSVLPGLTVDTASFYAKDTNFINPLKTDAFGILDADNVASMFSADNNMFNIKDTTVYLVSDTVSTITDVSSDYPFRYATSPYLSDSLEVAINTLMSYLHDRDSSLIHVTGYDGRTIPVWLNSKMGMMNRYWLKNDMNDSVTVWVGVPEYNTLGLYLEHGVNFKRPVRENTYAAAKIEKKEFDKSSLKEIEKIVTKPHYWKTRAEVSLSLNQAAMSNWTKGGENNLTILTELKGFADYNNKERRITSNNFARIRYGIIQTKEYGIRKNVDLFETSSKINTKAFGKFDFSGYLLFKTTIAKGYKYPNDSIPVSKFMNPGTVNIGFGLDYKPNRNTSINMAPLSYKGTFVLDTANIVASRYGIEAGRKSKNEPGGSCMITYNWQVAKNLRIDNVLHLFSNYIRKPQNIDIDWEMTIRAKLNWFTDLTINSHLIFDDDTKTVDYDKKGNPILGEDGQPKKTARVQFKDILGFTLIFRF